MATRRGHRPERRRGGEELRNNKRKPVLAIIRGLPGSGKSTYARKLVMFITPGYKIKEIDK